MVRPIAPWLLLLASACASETLVPGLPPMKTPARGPLAVQLLDAWFLVAEGERVAVPEFLYRFRVDCRRWAAADMGPPRVDLSWASNAVSDRFRFEFERQLQLAGARQIRYVPK